MHWLLNFAYLILLMAVSPWLISSALRHGKYRQGWGAKLLGRVPRRQGDRPCVWMHAVSVGEINALAPLLARWRTAFPDWDCVISTTTRTGYELACRKYADYQIFYCPLDFSWAVKNAMRRIRPQALLLTELELWPNLIRMARRQGAQVAVVNGRLSQSSARGYRRLRWLIRPLLQQLDLIAVQSESYAERFRQLGAPESAVVVTGSIKFDGAEQDRDNRQTRILFGLAGLTPNDAVWLAGSTYGDEEQLVLSAFEEVADEFPNLRLVLVPRHPERFDAVAELLQRQRRSWLRRSELSSPDGTPPPHGTRQPDAAIPPRILLVDTIGELAAWWGTAQLAYVGGSQGGRGGQNMIEPAAYGAAVSFGPDTRNFRDVVDLLLRHDAAVVVRDQAQLSAFVRRGLQDPGWRRELGAKAQSLVAAQQGATQRTIECLGRLIGTGEGVRRAA